MGYDNLMCTSKSCIYSSKCYRHSRGNPDNIQQCYVDLTASGCDVLNGFDYIYLCIQKGEIDG
jgi:hypothetical protein